MTLDDERLRQLGRLTAAAAELEFYLYATVCELSGDDVETAQRVVGVRSFSKLVKFARSQLAERGLKESNGEQLERFLRMATDAMEERNRFLHAHWVTDTTQALRARAGNPGVRLEVLATDIKVVADRLESAASGMNFMWIEIVNALGRLKLVDGIPQLTDWTGVPDTPIPLPHQEHVPTRWAHGFMSGTGTLSFGPTAEVE